MAELDSLYLILNLPSATISGRTYGTPRVGNPDFATFFDSKVADFTRMNNEKDLIPIVPGRFLGFSHVHGEVHIVQPGTAVACSGVFIGDLSHLFIIVIISQGMTMQRTVNAPSLPYQTCSKAISLTILDLTRVYG